MGKNLCPHLCPRAKIGQRCGFRIRLGAKMGISGLGYTCICIIYPQTGRPIFAIGRIEQLDLCPVFAAYLPSVFKFSSFFILFYLKLKKTTYPNQQQKRIGHVGTYLKKHFQNKKFKKRF